ncbi:uncharacterized protein LOC131077889 [Cryptomeria japonica]|uniref:uncharacterized protein LOC131077889 n=1 Tax=Cryptomeria japonica TaxID=3369 RepID=UPI0027DA9BD5|nr:uncharacterized protein LOC131077889 [Cryptomeria japonica]XP_057871466.2 uncharacterized protein LOC131077889 [Cryptomeria japonica]XP_059075549.1 uncharacterized protein LOC131077889 [Cryptomeria japonica]XP_059075550.1 uncharacterized protein LOC131077889 [Cryptomeria japonica]
MHLQNISKQETFICPFPGCLENDFICNPFCPFQPSYFTSFGAAKDKICLELYACLSALLFNSKFSVYIWFIRVCKINPIRCQTTYNSMPPPMDEVQIAKERAQEIVARLINNSNNGDSNALEADHPRPLAATTGDHSVLNFSSSPGMSLKDKFPLLWDSHNQFDCCEA